jgi:hypothetical protein
MIELTHNDITIRWIASNRYYATKYKGEQIMQGAVNLYTKPDGAVDTNIHRPWRIHSIHSEAREAILNIPPDMVLKLKVDSIAYITALTKKAMENTTGAADEFFKRYTEARMEFDDMVAHMADDLDVRYTVEEDGVSVQKYDKSTGRWAAHCYQL